MVEEIDQKKSIYFVILIIILIILAIVLTIHFNNKEFVDLKEYDVQTTKKVKEDIVTTTSTSNALKITDKVKYLKKSSMEDVYTTYSESDINTNIVVSFTNNKKLNLNIKKYDIDDNLRLKNIISLYDINLYDGSEYLDIHDNNVTIKIPFNSINYDYDYYKIAYLNDNNDVLEYIDPTINDGYIVFNTTHLSKYAIVGFKNEIDLTKTYINLYKNNNIVSDYTKVFKLSKDDLLNIIVNTEYKDYKLEYSLRSNDDSTSYQEFDPSLLSKINNTKEYTLIIKVIVNNKEKVFESIKFRVFDIIVTNDVIENVKKDAIENNETNAIIGEVKVMDQETEEVTAESDYSKKEQNKNILVDTEKEDIINNETQQTDNVTIEIKGNIYVLDETDLSNLELTGYLNIETSENVTFNTIKDNVDNEVIDTNNLIAIEINTNTLNDKIFTINDVKYTYVVNENSVTLKKVEDGTEVNNIFGNLNNISYGDNKLIFNKSNN